MLFALAVGACGGDDGGGGGPAAGEVQFLVFGDPEELRAYREVIAAFKTEEPDVRVQLVEASDRDDLLARLATSIAGGRPPDLFLLNYRFYGQFAAKGQLEPIEQRLSGSDAFEEDDFYPEALDAFRFDGELNCLPQNISSLVVYYNKALFRKAGLPPPRGDWTWKQFVDTAVKLTDRKRRQYGLGVEPSLIRIAPLVWSNGGELVHDDLSGFALDDPAAQEPLREFMLLHTAYRVIASEEEVEAEDDESRPRLRSRRRARCLTSSRSATSSSASRSTRSRRRSSRR